MLALEQDFSGRNAGCPYLTDARYRTLGFLLKKVKIFFANPSVAIYAWLGKGRAR
jgi:hypothetical protein